jgi:hypothetical protein
LPCAERKGHNKGEKIISPSLLLTVKTGTNGRWEKIVCCARKRKAHDKIMCLMSVRKNARQTIVFAMHFFFAMRHIKTHNKEALSRAPEIKRTSVTP